LAVRCNWVSCIADRRRQLSCVGEGVYSDATQLDIRVKWSCVAINEPLATTRCLIRFFFFLLTHGACELLKPVTTLLHSSLSAASCTNSSNERPHQSMISSTDLLGGLLLFQSPSTMPMIVFISSCLAYDIYGQITVASCAL